MAGNTAPHRRVVVLIAATAAATLGLHALGGMPGLSIDWAAPVAWIEASAPIDVVGAVLRLVGLVIGWWVLITTVLYYVAGLAGHARIPGWLSLVTMPPVRRVIDRVLATSLVLSIAATPAGPLRLTETTSSEPAPIVYELAADGIPVPHVEPAAPEQPDRTTDEAAQPGPAPVTPAGTAVSTPAPVATAGAEPISSGTPYTVVAGDNLWDISAAHLQTLFGDPPTEAEIREYWRVLIIANRPTLRSGDPNLIYPGELITMPGTEVSR